MNEQLIAVIALIALAALYVLRAFRLSLRKGSCGTGCGKCAAATEPESRPGMIPLEQIKKP
jgi:hypothetical protein